MNDKSSPKAALETPAKTSVASLTLTPDELAYHAQICADIGYKAALHAMRLGGEDAARAASSFLRLNPRYAELQKRREVDHRPCPARCGRCSRCVHADYWARKS